MKLCVSLVCEGNSQFPYNLLPSPNELKRGDAHEIMRFPRL